MSVTYSLNLAGLAIAVERVELGGKEGVRNAVEHVLTEANKTVPHDEGTLERSGEASTDGTTGAVSYNTPYAVKQHEDMSLRHDGKGQAKWLENTMTGEAHTVGEIIAAAIRGDV